MQNTKCVCISNLKKYKWCKVPFQYSDRGKRGQEGRKEGKQERRQASCAFMLSSIGPPKYKNAERLKIKV